MQSKITVCSALKTNYYWGKLELHPGSNSECILLDREVMKEHCKQQLKAAEAWNQISMKTSDLIIVIVMLTVYEIKHHFLLWGVGFLTFELSYFK